MMRELTDRDIFWIQQRMPDEVWKILVDYRQAFIAGGFLRACIAGESINDIDIFTNTKDRAEQLAQRLALKTQKKMLSTDNAYTVFLPPWPVQFIHRWSFDTPEDCVASFDFTIAAAAVFINGTDGSRHPLLKSVCDDDFYSDLAAKRLVYRSPVRNEDAGGSMLRLLKFYQRGYRAPLESIAAVMARMAHEIKDENLRGLEFNDKLTREQAIAKVFTGMLREVDPLIDPHHFSH